MSPPPTRPCYYCRQPTVASAFVLRDHANVPTAVMPRACDSCYELDVPSSIPYDECPRDMVADALRDEAVCDGTCGSY